MKITKIIAFILATLMAFSSFALFTSCDKKDNKVKEKTEEKKDKNNNGTNDDGDIFAERAAVDDELPDADYGGRQFRVVAHIKNEVYIEEEDRNQGDLIVDAKFNRNKAVEDRFNIEIVPVYTGTFTEVSDYVTKTVLSGVDEFDLLVNMAISTGGLVTKNLFLNWYDIPRVDFSKPWWAKSNSEELTYDGKCLLAVSDYNFSSIEATYCMLFNKNLAQSYDLGNIYDLVLDGKWTIDKLSEIVKDVYLDNGNSERDFDDTYGLSQAQGSAINTYLWAFDNPVIKKNEEGVPTIAIKTDKINNIVTKLYDLLYNNTGVYFNADKPNETSDSYPLFLARRAIFVNAQLSAPTGEELRNFEDDYGLIPYPKYDEAQKRYLTMADGYHSVLAVPKTCKDPEFVGTITEALSAETYKTVTPTLYEIALKTRYLRDEESKEVMDIIIDGRTFDFGYIYDNWKGYSFMLQTMLGSKNSNFESEYDKRFTGARMQYKSVVKAYDKLD